MAAPSKGQRRRTCERGKEMEASGTSIVEVNGSEEAKFYVGCVMKDIIPAI